MVSVHRANGVGSYQLLFIDGQEDLVRKLNIEVANDDAAITRASEQSLACGMPVEVWNSEFVVRVTPFTARLFMKE
jgi:hypothetical protein